MRQKPSVKSNSTHFTVYLFYICLTLAAFPSALFGSTTVQIQKDEPIQLVDAYIDYLQNSKELAERRLRISQKSEAWVTHCVGHTSNHKRSHNKDTCLSQGMTKLSRIQAQNADLIKQVKHFEKAISNLQLERGNPRLEPALIEEILKWDISSHLVQAQTCAADLEQIGDESNNVFLALHRLFISGVKNSSTTSGARAQALTRIRLLKSNYFCERRIAEWTDDRVLLQKPLAQCFYSKVRDLERARKINPVDVRFTGHSLANGYSIAVDPNLSLEKYSTGHEPALKNFITQQRKYSVKPWDIFAKSLELNNGNLRQTLHTSLNVFRANRIDTIFQRHLFDIRGDRALGGDNSGDWYHFFGTMLMEDIYRSATGMLSIAFRFVDVGESLDFTNSGSDPRENEIDQLGISVMADVRQLILSNAPVAPKACEFRNVFGHRSQ